MEAEAYSSLFWKLLSVCVCHTPKCVCVGRGGVCEGLPGNDGVHMCQLLSLGF